MTSAELPRGSNTETLKTVPNAEPTLLAVFAKDVIDYVIERAKRFFSEADVTANLTANPQGNSVEVQCKTPARNWSLNTSSTGLPQSVKRSSAQAGRGRVN